MTEVRVSRGIDARSGIVWEIVTDLDRAPRIMSSVEAVERLDDGTGFDVGTRWRETRRMLGRRSTNVVEVVALQAGRSFTLEGRETGTRYRTTLEVHAGPGATSTVTMHFAAEPQSSGARVAAALLGPLGRRSARRMIESDLDDIAVAASTSA